jgi:hypothetical protein
MELEPPPVVPRRGPDPAQWPRWTAGVVAALAVVAIGPRSGADEASQHPAATTCDPAATRPAPRAGDAAQTVAVEVPAVGVIDLVDGQARGAWTNSGRPPAAEDQLYVQHPDEFVEAPASIRDQVLRATWLPADGQACDAGSWVVATEAP